MLVLKSRLLTKFPTPYLLMMFWFMDNGILHEWMEYNDILSTFSKAFGMEINHKKSIMLQMDLVTNSIRRLKRLKS